MTEEEVLDNLCWHDSRNISGSDDKEPRENCCCDNCFYGRDKLAQEILKLRELLGLIGPQRIATGQEQSTLPNTHPQVGGDVYGEGG